MTKIIFLRTAATLALILFIFILPIYFIGGLAFFFGNRFKWYIEPVIPISAVALLSGLPPAYGIFTYLISLATQEFLKKQTDRRGIIPSAIITLLPTFIFYLMLYYKIPWLLLTI